MPRSDYRGEVAYAYAPEQGEARILGYSIAREYVQHGQRTDELAGTADMVRIHPEVVEVWDWKTGKSEASTYRWQLRLLGLAAARAAGVQRAVIHVVRVNEVDVDDSWHEDLDADDLYDVAGEVLRVWHDAPTAQPSPGPWCKERYCRARGKCGAFQNSEWVRA